MQILSYITIFFSTLLSPSLPAPQKMDFKTVCKNGCPAIITGASGRSFSKQKSEPKAEPEPKPMSKPMSIPEIVSTNSDFSTLLAAVSAAGLVEALSAEGHFTVFAPTNEAFAKVNRISWIIRPIK